MKTILSIAALSSLLFAGLGCDAGLTLRPKAPTFVAHAEFGGSQGKVAPMQSMAPTQVVAEPAAYSAAAPAAGVAPVANGYQQSGGVDATSATVVAPGTRIVGRVSKGAPRYYALDLAIGDSLSFKIYARRLQKTGLVNFRFLEPDNVALATATNFITAPTSEFERESMNATASQAGRHILKVDSDEPTEFRIDVITVNQAGM